MKQYLGKFFLVLAFISLTNLAHAQQCGSGVQLQATISTEGYWTVLSSPDSDCLAIFHNSITGEIDSTDANAFLSVTCIGDWSVVWHDGANTEQFDFSFVQGYLNIFTYPEYYSCLDSVQVAIDTIGMSNYDWFYTVDPSWEYYSEVNVTFDHRFPKPMIHKNFDNAVFGDSAHIDIPLIVTIFNGGCAHTESLSVTFYQKPEPFIGLDTLVCGDEIEFDVVPTIAQNYSEQIWYDNNYGNSYDAIPNDSYQTVINANWGDSLNIVFSEENTLGYNHPSCLVRDTVLVEFLKRPVADAGDSEHHICGNCIQLDASLDNSVPSIGRWLTNPEGFFGFSCGDNDPTSVVEENAWFYHATDVNPGVDTVYVKWLEYNIKSAQCYSVDSLPIHFWYKDSAFIRMNGSIMDTDSTCGRTYGYLLGNDTVPPNQYASLTWVSADGSPMEWFANGTSGAVHAHDIDSVKIMSMGQQAHVWKDIYLIFENGDIYGSSPAVCVDTSLTVSIRFDNPVVAEIAEAYAYPEPITVCGDTACISAVNIYDWSNIQWLTNDYLYFQEGYTGDRPDTLANTCVVCPSNIYPHSDTAAGGNQFHNLVLQVHNGMCLDHDTVNIRFAPVPTGHFVIEQPGCNGDQTKLIANTDANVGFDVYLTDFQWIFETGDEPINIQTNSLGDTVVVWYANSSDDDDYKHAVFLRTTNIWGCTNMQIQPDTIYEPWPIQLEWQDPVLPNIGACDGMLTIENASEDKNYSIMFADNENFDNYIDDIIQSGSSLNFENLCSGIYYLQGVFAGTNIYCRDTLQYVLFETYNDTCNGLYTDVDVTLCSAQGETDGAIDVTVYGGQAPYTYNWSGPDGYTSSEEDIDNLGIGVYTLNVMDANNCQEARPVYMYEQFDSTDYVVPVDTNYTIALDTCLTFEPTGVYIYSYLFSSDQISIVWLFVGEDDQMQFVNLTYEISITEAGLYSFAVSLDCDLYRSTQTFYSEIYLDPNFDISVKDIRPQNMNLYPNPTHGRVMIDTKNVEKVMVTNLSGSVIGTFRPQANLGTSVVDLSQQKAGVYLFYIQTKDGTYISKVIKQ